MDTSTPEGLRAFAALPRAERIAEHLAHISEARFEARHDPECEREELAAIERRAIRSTRLFDWLVWWLADFRPGMYWDRQEDAALDSYLEARDG